MTFLDKLQSHKGCLIHLKTQLYWYGGRGWDNSPGRICLLLDAEAEAAVAATATAADASDEDRHAALLLSDGQPRWIWVTECDIDLLVNDPPTN